MPMNIEVRFRKEYGGRKKNDVIEELIDKFLARSETVSHIAECLNRAQPTIFNSIELLLEGNYVRAQQEYKRGPNSILFVLFCNIF
jgi:predicted transcriptional regulator